MSRNSVMSCPAPSKLAFIAVTMCVVSACGGGGGSTPASAAPPPTAGPPTSTTAPYFGNATASTGIQFTHLYIEHFGSSLGIPLFIQRFAGGVAAGDYDGDGDIDLFIVRGDAFGNLLYQNDGNGVFVDRAEAAGVAFTKGPGENYRHSGPSFADLDGDGNLDLFIGGLRGDPSMVYRNNGDGTFSDVTAGANIDALAGPETISSAFGDYDLDGDLDMFLAHWGTPRDRAAPGDTLHLWRNDSTVGSIRFESVSEEANISQSVIVSPQNTPMPDDHDYTFAPSFARVDDDPYPDILSVADFNGSQYFRNRGDGTFANVTDEAVIVDNNGMGSAVADYDNDGDLDWFVSAIYDGVSSSPFIGNRLFRNDDGQFEDVTDDSGVIDGGWGWGACFADLNNDGMLDIYHTNGWIYNQTYLNDPSKAFIQNPPGALLRFVEKSREIGIQDTYEGRGVVCADFDGDGDTDVFVTHRDPDNAGSLYRNDIQARNYLTVKLQGNAPNTDAVGARIFVTVDGVTQMREVSIASNFTSQNPTEQIFGLGEAAVIDELRVEWPLVAGQAAVPDFVATAVSVNQRMTLDQPAP